MKTIYLTLFALLLTPSVYADVWEDLDFYGDDKAKALEVERLKESITEDYDGLVEVLRQFRDPVRRLAQYYGFTSTTNLEGGTAALAAASTGRKKRKKKPSLKDLIEARNAGTLEGSMAETEVPAKTKPVLGSLRTTHGGQTTVRDITTMAEMERLLKSHPNNVTTTKAYDEIKKARAAKARRGRRGPSLGIKRSLCALLILEGGLFVLNRWADSVAGAEDIPPNMSDEEFKHAKDVLTSPEFGRCEKEKATLLRDPSQDATVVPGFGVF